MSVNDVLTHLSDHDFRTLFIERLGWDRASGRFEALADGTVYVLATSIQSLSDAGEPGWLEARSIADRQPSPLQALERDAARSAIETALATLSEQDARMIRLRYGFDGDPQTLEQVAQEFGLTRERIRQRLERSEDTLRPVLSKMAFDGWEHAATTAFRKADIGNDDGSSARDAVMNVVIVCKAGIGAVEFASRCGLQRADRKSAIRSLLSEGAIVQMGRGRRAVYSAAQPATYQHTAPDGQAVHAH